MGGNWLKYLYQNNIDFVVWLPDGYYRIPIGQAQAPGAVYSKLRRKTHQRKRSVIKFLPSMNVDYPSLC